MVTPSNRDGSAAPAVTLFVLPGTRLTAIRPTNPGTGTESPSAVMRSTGSATAKNSPTDAHRPRLDVLSVGTQAGDTGRSAAHFGTGGMLRGSAEVHHGASP